MIPFQKAGIEIYSCPVIGGRIWGETNILDALIGYAEAKLTYDFERGRFYAGGTMTGTVQVPSKIPIFGGWKFMELGGTINTDYAMLFFYIGKTRYAVRYSWSNQVLSLSEEEYD